MDEIIRYTSPLRALRVMGQNIEGCRVWVSYEQGPRELDVEPVSMEWDGEGTVLTVDLTQEQTAKFREGSVKVQVNWVTPEGRRDATVTKTIGVLENLLEEVKGYGD